MPDACQSTLTLEGCEKHAFDIVTICASKIVTAAAAAAAAATVALLASPPSIIIR